MKSSEIIGNPRKSYEILGCGLRADLYKFGKRNNELLHGRAPESSHSAIFVFGSAGILTPFVRLAGSTFSRKGLSRGQREQGFDMGCAPP